MKRATLTAKKEGELQSGIFLVIRNTTKIQKLFFIMEMMLGSKAHNNDANGLLRAMHSHNPTRYSHIMVLTPHFYAHIGASPKVFHPPMSKLMWA